MSAGINPRGTHARLPSAAALSSVALLLVGCGAAANNAPMTTAGGSGSPTSKASTRSPTLASSSSASPTTATRATPSGVDFSKCMRAHGVPTFPDPTPGPGIGFQVSPTEMASPSYVAAESHCRQFMPPGPLADHTPPSRQTMARLLRIATCMRAHGVHQFPDPLYTAPKHISPGAYQEISNFDGAVLLFPANMNLQAPAYRHALTSCGAPPLGLPH